MFAVADVTAAAEYYKDKLGFTIRVIWGEPPFYAIVERGKVSINFINSETFVGDRGDVGGAYIMVDDVDELHAELKANGVELWGEPEDRDYGMRDFIALDNNGYRLCFGRDLEKRET